MKPVHQSAFNLTVWHVVFVQMFAMEFAFS